jgi:membrane protein YqaA with SNARE-associated domain
VASHTRAVSLLERFGQPALLLSWVPVIGDAIVALAGAVGIHFVPFSLWVFAGKLARYAAVGWLAAHV